MVHYMYERRRQPMRFSLRPDRYDNEIGYSDKILCLIEHMYSVDHK